jgi:hypothetical protein
MDGTSHLGGAMSKRILVLVAATAAFATSISLATAASPDSVSMTIVETFNPTIGTFTASGGIFGSQTTGTSTGVYFKLDSFSSRSPEHFIVFSAANRVSTDAGSFLVVFEASCRFDTFDPATGDGTAVCSGNWQVNGGTGAYERLQGTGTFTEPETTNVYNNTGGGTNTLVGRLQLR